jgi:hypothetical protein
MNMMAMKVTLATVTVYFVGLVNFRSVGSTSAEVIVPLATSTNTEHQGIRLAPHRADVVITGFAGTRGDCPGDYVDATTVTPAICTIKNLSNQTIVLPTSSSPALTTSGFDIPHLKNVLCKDVDAVSSGYAATMTIKDGTLQACRDDQAWVSYLTIANASNKIKIGANEYTLSTSTPVIEILNAPNPPDTRGDGKRHFWWYYAMYTKSSECQALPDVLATSGTCPADFPRHFHAASGVGCSNTQYP